MMIRALTLAAGLAAASTAHAGFQGVDIIADADATAAARALGGDLADATVYRMFAAWDTDGNEFLNIFNVNFQIGSTGSLFQDTLFGGGQDLMPWGSGQIDFQASLEFDTWATVNGGAAQEDGNGVNFAGTGMDMDSGWFTTPPTGLGIPVLNPDVNGFYTVLLGQFTVIGADTRADITGDYDLTFNDENGETVQGNSAELTGGAVQGFGFIPTPGAMALFGLAGLTAARRRRSA